MTTPGKFVHLHCHSHYSLLDGANRIPELVQQVKKQGMEAIALTDHGNLYGAIEFYREATAIGIKPIVGYEAYVAHGKRSERAAGRGNAGFHLTLLAQNFKGFQNLIQLSSIAFMEGYHYVPRIDKELLEAHSEGLICLSGCLSGEFNESLRRGDVGKATELAEWFARVFKGNFNIEIQKNGLDIQDQCTFEAERIAAKLGVPLVATADAHYLCFEDAIAHDVLICMNTGAKRADTNRMRYGDGSKMKNPYYVRSPMDMYKLFPEHQSAVARSQEIANSVDIQIDFKKRYFPVFAQPAGLSPEEYLRKICYEGLKERYGDTPSAAVVARLEHELGIICRMGFASYFLIVWDFVRFAREEGIPASARGSGCGAVVSYVLFLSHVCPLEYDLLFERFLDPNRSEAPDIDIDFCQERRENVIAYVKRKYGEQSVAQIATFGTLAAKAAIQSVGRVLDIPLDRVNFMSKWVSPKPGTSIEDTMKDSSDFRREYESDPLVREWIDIAIKLEGTNRNAGTHAAGVVIANGPITDYVPIQRVVRKGEDGNKTGEVMITTQWVMGDIEKIGLLKMDFLGLRTLTVVDNCLKQVERTRGIKIDLFAIPLDDIDTYRLLTKGDAKGVFQFESEGIRELLKRMKPDNIRDIIASTALYRPGPLEGGMVDEYIECKHGRKKPVYPHAVMEEILSETYGVMVYQEQVMRILNRLGNIELSSAYACIKAISKKKEDIINARKIDFVKGAVDNGMQKEKALEIFEMIVKFGGYGFNKSHSAAYAQLSYHTAWLKRHYTAEFMAALLSSEVDDGNKRDMLVDHIGDARKFGVQVMPPNINEGEADFTVRNGNILFGLVAIKGLGRGAVVEIVRARNEKGPFRDLFDFCERLDTRIVQRSHIEKLIKAGAIDQFADPFAHRAQLMIAFPNAMQSAQGLQEDRKRGQKSFFDALADSADGEDGRVQEAIPLPSVTRWTNTEQLKFEKEALDFYFSSHPLAEFDAELKRFATHEVGTLQGLRPSEEVRIGGMISQVRPFTSPKNGRQYVRCKVEDFTGIAECVMWSEDYARFRDNFLNDRIYLFEGKVEFSERNNEAGLVLRKLITLEEARRDLAKGMVLKLSLGTHGPDTVDGLRSILRRAKGECTVYMQVRDAGGRRAQFRLSDDLRVDPAKTIALIEEIEMLLGPGSILFTGK